MTYENSWADLGRSTPRCRCGRWIGFDDYESGNTGHYHRGDAVDEYDRPCDPGLKDAYPCDVEWHWDMVCPACKAKIEETP